MAKKPPDGPSEYEVGFRRPPKSSRWKPGQSGNPSGKKKGTKNYATILNSLAARKIKLTEQGRVRKISAHEGLYVNFFGRALKGDFKTAEFLLNKLEAVQRKQVEREGNRALAPRVTKDMTAQEASDAYAQLLKDIRENWEDPL